MNEVISSSALSRVDLVTVRECLMYGGLDGRIFSYRPQESLIFYRVLNVKTDIAKGAILQVHQNPIIDRIDFEADYLANEELPLIRHLNDKLENEYVPPMTHDHVHVEGQGFAFGFGVIAVGRRMKGHPFSTHMPKISPTQLE